MTGLFSRREFIATSTPFPSLRCPEYNGEQIRLPLFGGRPMVLIRIICAAAIGIGIFIGALGPWILPTVRPSHGMPDRGLITVAGFLLVVTGALGLAAYPRSQKVCQKKSNHADLPRK
jgi:hypothetical protein